MHIRAFLAAEAARTATTSPHQYYRNLRILHLGEAGIKPWVAGRNVDRMTMSPSVLLSLSGPPPQTAPGPGRVGVGISERALG
jgi:hypothetical protein